MAIKTQSLRGFLRGLISVTNRFSTPKGANILMSNLLMNERGALQTCDGSVVTSVLPGGITQPILALAYYVDPNFIAANNKLVGLVVQTATTVQLYNFSTNPATLLISNIAIDSGWMHPQMFNFAGQLVITLGYGTEPQLYTEPGGIPTITTLSTTNLWKANHRYQIGDIIDALNGHSFQVVSIGGVTTPAQGGISGGTVPMWPVPGGNPNPYAFDNTIVWQLLGPNSLAADLLPTGGAHGISHEGAMWLFGTWTSENANAADGPMSLRQSHLNSPDEWPAIYAAFIGKDDGQRATGIGSFTIAEAGIAPQGGLVLFKDYSTYNLTANFANSSFAINPVKTDLGCVAPRSVQFVPAMGLARLSHLGVAIYDGVQDQLISEEIRPYILGGFGVTGMNTAQADNARSALVSNPPMYTLAIPTGTNTWCSRILAYDLIQKSWSVVDLPFQISSFTQIRVPTDFSSGGQAAFPITYMGGAADGKVRRWQAGDASNWDTGAAVAWSVTTPEVGNDTTGRIYFRRTTIRLHAPSAPTIKFTPIYGNDNGPVQSRVGQEIGPVSSGPNQGGNQGQQTEATYEGDNDYIIRFTQGVTGQTQRITLSGTGRVTLESIEMDLVPKPSLPLGQPV